MLSFTRQRHISPEVTTGGTLYRQVASLRGRQEKTQALREKTGEEKKLVYFFGELPGFFFSGFRDAHRSRPVRLNKHSDLEQL